MFKYLNISIKNLVADLYLLSAFNIYKHEKSQNIFPLVEIRQFLKCFK